MGNKGKPMGKSWIKSAVDSTEILKQEYDNMKTNENKE